MAVLLQTKMPDGRPVLILGMIGFSGAQESEIERLLAARQGGAVGWRTGAVSKADAWWINGALTQLLADGSLRIGSVDPRRRSVHLALADVRRPVAFCEPLASRDLEPAYSFRIGDPASVGRVLDVMETHWLACTAVRRWLAARLIATGEALTQPIYHLVHGERLLAVINSTGDLGWAPGATVADLENAVWLGRPPSARFIPPSFQRTTMSELVSEHAAALRRSKDQRELT